MPVIIGILALVGCSCPDIVSVIPVDGAGPVARDEVITATMSDDPRNAEFTVTGPDGQIAGTVAITGADAVFTPDALLPADASIAWTVAVCGNSASGTFTTGTLDGASEASALDGNAYAVDLAGATWVSPPNGGALVSQFFAGALLVGVQSAGNGQLDCIGSTGQATQSGGWQQDPCFATIDFPSADFGDNPYFAIQTDLVEFSVQGMPARIHGVTLSGGITAEHVTDGQFSGEVDFREYTSIGDGCSMIDSFLGIQCTACRSDGVAQCLWIEAHDVNGDVVPGLTVVPNENPQECNADTGGH